MKCELREELCYLRKDAKIKFKSKHITPVPPYFIEKIAECLYVLSGPCATLLALLPLYIDFSASPKQDESNPYIHSRYLLQFLWLATCGDIELSGRSSLPVHPKLEGFFNDHLESLLPRSPPQSTNISNDLVTATSRLTAVIKDIAASSKEAERLGQCDERNSNLVPICIFGELLRPRRFTLRSTQKGL